MCTHTPKQDAPEMPSMTVETAACSLDRTYQRQVCTQHHRLVGHVWYVYEALVFVPSAETKQANFHGDLDCAE